MKIQEKSLKDIKETLQQEKEFRDLTKWKFKHIPLGEMQHTYLISRGQKNYFLKELKTHEAQMEFFLCKCNLKHLPSSIYPNLLKHKILVRKFISGRMLRSKNIDLGLLRDFAMMRNTLNKKTFFDKHNIMGLKNYSQKDDGFYARELYSSFLKAPRILKALQKYKLQEVTDFQNILSHLKKDKKAIIHDFVSMPFAKQHQDFREDNIIVGTDGKQRLIDWGSSYGYNPFMYDVAPFLVHNPKALQKYVKISNICKGKSQKVSGRWLYVALVARFLDVITSRLHPSEGRTTTKEKCRKYLKYEYKTYKELINNENKTG